MHFKIAAELQLKMPVSSEGFGVEDLSVFK
jgi:hypothetical protein